MHIVVAPEALSAEVDGATVILAPDMRYLRLDGTGSIIWDLVQTGRDFDAILDELCRNFDVSLEQATHDVMAFLQDLSEKGVLTLEA